MSDTDDPFNVLNPIRDMERHFGRPLSTEETAWAERMAAAAKKAVAELDQTVLGEVAEYPLLDFMLKLISRQGTIAPDFEALYKKKAEFDRKLFHDSP